MYSSRMVTVAMLEVERRKQQNLDLLACMMDAEGVNWQRVRKDERNVWWDNEDRVLCHATLPR